MFMDWPVQRDLPPPTLPQGEHQAALAPESTGHDVDAHPRTQARRQLEDHCDRRVRRRINQKTSEAQLLQRCGRGNAGMQPTNGEVLPGTTAVTDAPVQREFERTDDTRLAKRRCMKTAGNGNPSSEEQHQPCGDALKRGLDRIRVRIANKRPKVGDESAAATANGHHRPEENEREDDAGATSSTQPCPVAEVFTQGAEHFIICDEVESDVPFMQIHDLAGHDDIMEELHGDRGVDNPFGYDPSNFDEA